MRSFLVYLALAAVVGPWNFSKVAAVALESGDDTVSRNQTALRREMTPVNIPTCTYDENIALNGTTLVCERVNCTLKYFGTRNVFNTTVRLTFSWLISRE